MDCSIHAVPTFTGIKNNGKNKNSPSLALNLSFPAAFF